MRFIDVLGLRRRATDQMEASELPGIGFSPDKMLQARLFSYGDTQRYRLGVNFNNIPVNAPKCPFHSYHRDRPMRTDNNLGGMLSFHPTSAGLSREQIKQRHVENCSRADRTRRGRGAGARYGGAGVGALANGCRPATSGCVASIGINRNHWVMRHEP